MKLFFYASPENTSAQQLLFEVNNNNNPSREAPVVVLKLSEMVFCLKNSVKTQDIVILLLSTIRELDTFLHFRDFFEDARLILILPDFNPETVAKGHLLQPRFLTSLGTEFSDVTAVLDKMFMNAPTNFSTTG